MCAKRYGTKEEDPSLPDHLRARNSPEPSESNAHHGHSIAKVLIACESYPSELNQGGVSQVKMILCRVVTDGRNELSDVLELNSRVLISVCAQDAEHCNRCRFQTTTFRAFALSSETSQIQCPSRLLKGG
jgi:hypothetical protein